jgi:hypothetical protein
MISFLEFHEKMLPEGCFSIYQALACFPSFDRNSLTRWTHKHLLIKLRQGWYAFPQMLQCPDFSRFVACRIYRPSYISSQMALSIYGMIPEAVTSITSVTTLKTMRFENEFGQYSYQNIKPSLFFGYKPVILPAVTPSLNAPKQTWFLAEPEKALLDFLYLYSFYDDETSLANLRLDESYMTDELNIDRLMEYSQRIGSKALSHRIKTLLKIYGL